MFTSSLFHVFNGSFPVLYDTFSSIIIIMLKIKAVLGTNTEQKIRAAACTTGRHNTHRLLPLICHLLLLLHLHKEKLPTHYEEESTFYFQRRRRNRTNHRHNGETQGMPVLCKNIGVTRTARNDHPMLWSYRQPLHAFQNKKTIHVAESIRKWGERMYSDFHDFLLVWRGGGGGWLCKK